jgi:hypothetical protein
MIRIFKGVFGRNRVRHRALIFSWLLFVSEPKLLISLLCTIPGTNIDFLNEWIGGIANFFTYNIDHLGKLIVLFHWIICVPHLFLFNHLHEGAEKSPSLLFLPSDHIGMRCRCRLG